MRYEHEIQVVSDPNCYLGIGKATWDDTTDVIKNGWYQKNGRRSRPGGEWPMPSFLQGITELIRVGKITPEQALEAVIAGMKPAATVAP